jgi:hypothetical protein
MSERDFDKQPYTADEKRVADYIIETTGGTVGGGDDPIGFLMSAHALVVNDRNRALEAFAP